METDVAAFARQLKQDGIDAAKAEAAQILAEARSQAAEIRQQAQAESDKLKKDALRELENQRLRHTNEVRLLARDIMLKVKQDIERVAMRLLRTKVGEVLSSEEVIRTAILELVRNPSPGQEWEVSVGSRISLPLVQAVVNELFKEPHVRVVLAEEFHRTGLEFRTHGGTEVLELSEDSILEAFRHLMSPELSRLIDSLPA
jgi:V/A-type H+-transporting ATPase subunit E